MSDIWNNKLLGVLGGGNMAEALVRGVLAANLVPAQRVVVYDPLPARREVFRSLGCMAANSPQDIVAADVVLLATKPQTLAGAVGDLKYGPGNRHLFVSIAAGVSTRSIEGWLPADTPVIRIMPNTPLLIGMGVSALARGRVAGAMDMLLALELFSCCGQAVEVDESFLDAVTALSGSGPAYLFRFAEALMAGAEKLGLAPDLAKSLTIGMLRGSAEMLARYGNAAELRERVTSPGGTTAAALAVFEECDFQGMVASALDAACRRSQELGRGQ